ncbi:MULTISPECIES: helix-turn-helix transcriptional regulator [unclassified Streptomyces]|uniref:helix-turn-helix domain-containing protein n=1 Tax=unclassified Streptomyces TaxID=2593676 RepID=UPI0023D8FE36|nr:MULTISPECIES: helix-turn-helix transcriptional regulator [unclassified Streptomyces]MCH0567302.1 helix-turn-helix transcriptional regulator [Streptomyces sp. MUM 2J]MCH0573014.1 helix-turn-helix transcriptional regulator [Streptomyces sp. MUM 136J]
MPTRPAPTERQKRLGAELRRMRLDAGRTTEYAAGLLGLDRTKVSNMESGIRGASPERIRTLASNYECSDEAYIEGLVAMADTRKRCWWHQFRGALPQGLLDVAELEWFATRLRSYQTVHVPGLLQLGAYARAVFAAALPPLPPSEVELRVVQRLRRQQVLDRDPGPVDYVAYVHEWALRMQFGGRRAMREQLLHLCDASERPNVEIRVLPVEAGAFPGAGHAVLYAHGAVPRLDTVQLDSAHGGEFTHSEAQLTKYRSHMDWWHTHTLSPEHSRDLIRAIAHQL